MLKCNDPIINCNKLFDHFAANVCHRCRKQVAEIDHDTMEHHVTEDSAQAPGDMEVSTEQRSFTNNSDVKTLLIRKQNDLHF